MQLLSVVIPRLERLRKEGQSGETKITQYTRYLTLALAVLQSTGIVALARSNRLIPGCTTPIIRTRACSTPRSSSSPWWPAPP